MEIITTVSEMKARVSEWKAQGLTIGLTPTMGALHEGHMSLMEAARKECDRVVTSVFVNPLQFGPDEDYDNYPRDLERDAGIAESKGVDVVFHPNVEEMYPENYNTYVVMETLTDTLCGASRPGHFRGVCTVVNKLFNIVQPDKAFFGQKDAQQLAIIMRMVSDLNMNLEVVGCPIVREDDGLAKSSRNTYLSTEERTAALCLSRAIFKAKKMIEDGERNSATIAKAVTDTIEEEPLARIDYVEVVNLGNMQPVETLPESGLVAIAVYIGSTRLIDNYLYDFD
jgi:pantoate--beta-alanine ligase